jgi:hypothetical protein
MIALTACSVFYLAQAQPSAVEMRLAGNDGEPLIVSATPTLAGKTTSDNGRRR